MPETKEVWKPRFKPEVISKFTTRIPRTLSTDDPSQRKEPVQYGRFPYLEEGSFSALPMAAQQLSSWRIMNCIFPMILFWVQVGAFLAIPITAVANGFKGPFLIACFFSVAVSLLGWYRSKKVSY